MEIRIQASDLRSRLLHRTPPPSPLLLHAELPGPSLCRFSYPFAPTTRSHKPPRTSILSLTPNLLPLISSSKPLTTAAAAAAAYPLPDDAVSGSVTKAVDVDPALAVKVLCFVAKSGEALSAPVMVALLIFLLVCSDNLVEEAGGGESAGKSFKERDEEGFHESETEVLKQLSSMGRLVVCAGNGAVQSSTNLALLRHGISIWIDVPLDIVARDIIENRSQLSPSEILSSGSYSEAFNQLTVLYGEMSGGYATADATVSLLKVASQLGYEDFDAVTKEDMAMEVLNEIQKLIRVKKMMEEAARPF